MKKYSNIFCLTLILTFTVCSCHKVARDTGKVLMKEVVEETTETGAKKGGRFFLSKIFKETGEELNEKLLIKLGKDIPGLKSAISKILKETGFETSELIVKKGPHEGNLIYWKGNPRISMEIKGRYVYANAGSHVKTDGLNNMLNHLLPNKTYVIDDCFTYKTDKYGRVVEAIADRTKAKHLPTRTTPHSPTQSLVSSKGIPGDQSGHLFARSTNGPNEAINQVPMQQFLNEHGRWRELERIEEQALSKGKNVISRRRLIYGNPNSSRPTELIFEYTIDGVTKSERIINYINP